MPATFVAADTGPLEPTLYHMFQAGRPRLLTALPPPRVEAVLAEIWQRFGTLDDDAVGEAARRERHYRTALRRERMAEIDLSEAAADPDRDRAPDPPPPASDRPPMTIDGRVATKWTPGAYAKKKP